MIYNIAVNGEQQEVKALWKSEQIALGIPYMTDIDDYINNNQLYVIRDNNKIIAYCTYDIMKRDPEVRLSALVVAPEYRGRGLSKELIYQIYKVNEVLINELYYPFVAEAKEGIPNNTFYDNISTNMTRSQKKTCVIRTYTLDVNKIKTWGPSKWL